MSLQVTYYLQFVAVFILMTWAVYLPFRAGQLYNGPIYCMAIGGYFSAFVVGNLGWPFGLTLIITIALGAIMGFIPALGFSKTTGLVTATASIALIYIIQSILRNLAFLGGARGLWNIPKVGYLLPLSYVLILIVGVIIYRFDHSRYGRAAEAMLVDLNLASAMGINTRWLSIVLLTLSSVIGALAGVIYAFTLRTIFPDSFGFSLLLSIWGMLYIGGRYTMWGALISAPILWGLPQWLPNTLTEYTKIIYGIVIIVIILILPEGIVNRDMLRWIREKVRILSR